MNLPRSRYQSTSYDIPARTSYHSPSHSFLRFYPITCTHLMGVYMTVVLCLCTTLDQVMVTQALDWYVSFSVVYTVHISILLV